MKRALNSSLIPPAVLAMASICAVISMVYARGGMADQLLVVGVLGVAVFIAVMCLAGLGRRWSDRGILLTSQDSSVGNHETASAGFPDTFSSHVERVLRRTDTVFQDLAQLRLASLSAEFQQMAAGQLVFTGRESWRTAYERILRIPGLTRYHSVAWLRTEDYWRDAPGRRSIQLNYDLVELGLPIERIVILNDFFWAPAALLPARPVLAWLVDQHKHGISLRLVRESEIEDEIALLGDFGIYGDRAVGILELDDQCRSLRFTLDFDPQSVRLAEERWRRLELFAVSFREVLDRGAQGR